MYNLPPARDVVKSLRIDADELRRVAEELWSIRGELKPDDLDMIDGTFLRRCVSWFQPNNGFVIPPDDPWRDFTPAAVGLQAFRQGESGGWHHVDRDWHHRSWMIPVASWFHAWISNGRWDGARVEAFIRACPDHAFAARTPELRTLPPGMTLPATLALHRQPSLEAEDGEPDLPAFARVLVGVPAHASLDLMPPPGAIEATYEAVVRHSGWRLEMSESNSNQSAVSAIRTWYIELLKTAGSSHREAVEAFLALAGPGYELEPQQVTTGLKLILRRVPEASFLREKRRWTALPYIKG